MRTRSAAGFTLIEVLVALLVGAIVILGARALLDGLSLQAIRVASLAQSADAEANREHTLRAAVARAGMAGDSIGRFDGTPEAASFASWCDAPGGWQERCSVRLSSTSESRGGGRTLVLELGETGRIDMGRSLDAVTFRYLASAADGGHWVDRWEGAILPPLAIGVITRSDAAGVDTMVLRIGDRR